MKKIIIDKEILYNKFIIEGRSVDDIIKEIGFSRKTILRRLKEFNITKIKKGDFDNKEWLYNEYIIKNKRIKDISREQDVNESVIKLRLKRFNIKKDKKEIQKHKEETCINKYGVRNPRQNYDIINKARETCINKYGVISFSKTKEFKKMIGDCSLEQKRKEYETKKKNNSFNSSKPEEELYVILCNKYDDVIRNKIIDKYNCDFYIPSINLYIEFNGHWSHGNCIFNKNNINHREIIKKWESKNNKYYKNALYVWTKKDPKKREYFISNSLKLLEIWEFNNEEDVYNQIRRVC